MMKIKTTIVVILLLAGSLFAQDSFVRSAQITPPDTYASGFGATVSGVDLDGDGKLEIYSVDGMSDFMTGDEIPQIIKYERNGTAWDSVWAASLPTERQNSWAALTVGDMDGDGKKEIIWGFTNSFTTNTKPPRIVVFEANGDDVLGISDGNGNYKPNATWDFDLADSYNVRPLKWYAVDVDGDNNDEVLFAGRQNTITFGIIDVTDIPDAGDGSETWSFKLTNQTKLINKFSRSAVIDGPDGGFGGVLTGMDYDGDGNMDLYTVNDDWNDGANGELIPKIYKYELINGAWVLQWTTRLPGIDYQNSWPVITAGDWDGDGKGEIQWCPINNFGAGNEDPDRIVVYETPGDGTDVMGIDNGDGTYSPNAGWNMDVDSSTSMRPFRGLMTDIDGDGNLEFVFTERHNYYVWGVVGVSDIPDNGDGSETWTMKANGTPDAGNDYRDIAAIGQTIYLFSSGGGVRTITNDGTNYTVSAAHQAYPGWSWLSATTADIDGDTNMEIVTGDYGSSGSHGVWVLVPDADSLVGHMIADFSANTYNQITNTRVGDLNNDGMTDIVVGFRQTDEIYRVAYKGGDITASASYEVTRLDSGVLGETGVGQFDMMAVADLNNDGSDEVIYTGVPRSLASNTEPMTIGSYTDTLSIASGSRWDIAIANESALIFDGSGNMQRIDMTNGEWDIHPQQPALVNGTFLSASTTDVDGDGTEEVIVSNWYDAKVNMLRFENGAYVAYPIADFTDMGGNRLNGGAVGDIDGDGNVDFVTGTRESVPVGQIYRVEYTGGDITDMASWKGELIDSELDPKFTQYEVINIANLDEDADMEVLYTSDYARGPNTDADPAFPIVILDLQKVQTTPIADAKVDANGDFKPDLLGTQVVIKGVVTTPDYNLSSTSSSSFYIQDETAGINIYASSPKPTLALEVGDLVQITGTIDFYNGLTELAVSDGDVNIVKLGLGTVPTPMVATPEEFNANGEKYEGSLVKIVGVTLVDGAWPAAGSNANLTFSDSYMDFVVRIDKDMDIAGQAEPTYPVSITGVGGQYDSGDPANSGYQLTPRYYTDIEQNVAVPPNPHFALLTPADNAVISMTDSSETWDATWNAAIDLNGDNVVYQFFTTDGSFASNPLTDTMFTITALDILDGMNGADTLVAKWSIRAKGSETAFVASVDTFTVTFINDIPVGIDEEAIPTKFYVAQNYPNPFNPTTTIRFGLPQESNVDLRIYDILGQQVAVLINNQIMKSAHHEVHFNASSLASGTYIYRLQAGDKVETKKMLLLK